ncbi:MAG: hypothetical protein ACIAS6_08945 [Phycisphaerales bacterium JB060]
MLTIRTLGETVPTIRLYPLEGLGTASAIIPASEAVGQLRPAGDPSVDFDGDRTLDIFDFLAFLNQFEDGCR